MMPNGRWSDGSNRCAAGLALVDNGLRQDGRFDPCVEQHPAQEPGAVPRGDGEIAECECQVVAVAVDQHSPNTVVRLRGGD